MFHERMLLTLSLFGAVVTTTMATAPEPTTTLMPCDYLVPSNVMPEDMHLGDAAKSACATLPWAPWSPCSATCGHGHMTRRRQYAWPERARELHCSETRLLYMYCSGPRLHCRALPKYEPDAADKTGPCAVSQWSAWGRCEGCGWSARSRHYLTPNSCRGIRARVPLIQAEPCSCHK